jgi:hypothetical protein
MPYAPYRCAPRPRPLPWPRPVRYAGGRYGATGARRGRSCCRWRLRRILVRIGEPLGDDRSGHPLVPEPHRFPRAPRRRRWRDADRPHQGIAHRRVRVVAQRVGDAPIAPPRSPQRDSPFQLVGGHRALPFGGGAPCTNGPRGCRSGRWRSAHTVRAGPIFKALPQSRY